MDAPCGFGLSSQPIDFLMKYTFLVFDYSSASLGILYLPITGVLSLPISQ